MTIVLFLVVLAILIFVHELGHFLAAKSSDIRVDEFGLGFPPRAWGYKPQNSETLYSLNWLPIGGFVRIFGEDPDDEAINGPDKDRSFVHKSKLTQIGVLGAGVAFNLIFAWLLISIGFMTGLPTSTAEYDAALVEDPHLTVTSVLPNSPAEQAGLAPGDRLIELEEGTREAQKAALTLESVKDFIVASEDRTIDITIERAGEEQVLAVTPEEGVIEGSYGIGIAYDEVGIVSFPPHTALWEGGKLTVALTQSTALGLWGFFRDAFTGSADFSQVAGPVGLVGLVGDASSLGFVYLLSFTAIISINLAIINMIPFPALDGGRILFVIIEAIKRSPIKPKVANAFNLAGFVLLLALMAIVTFSDIARLIGA